MKTHQSIILSAKKLREYGLRDRSMSQILHRFLEINKEVFSFLNINAFVTGIDKELGIKFQSGSFIGAIPLKNPLTGKPFADFLVIPRYAEKTEGNNYTALINQFKESIEIDYLDNATLLSTYKFSSPNYLLAIDFIKQLKVLMRSPWVKFKAVKQQSLQPEGKIDWNAYALQSAQVEKRLNFPTHKTVISSFHEDFEQINFVFNLCKKEMESNKTPIVLRQKWRKTLQWIEHELRFHKTKTTTHIKLTASDQPTVKTSKRLANKFLDSNKLKSIAWRLDFSEVFEKMVQHLFQKVAETKGGQLKKNFRIQGYSNKKTSWELSHLEPDAIYQKEDLSIAIDAKYKSHLYNLNSSAEYLKETHRQDLHQILAYSSFQNSTNKIAFLCYPYSKLFNKALIYQNSLNNTQQKIVILGLPVHTKFLYSGSYYLPEEISKIIDNDT